MILYIEAADDDDADDDDSDVSQEAELRTKRSAGM